MAFVLALVAGCGTAQAEAPRVVVELFTSQGCAACPPADTVLKDMAHRPGVFVLSAHVPYWDRLGWRDPFALKSVEARQRRYAKSLGVRMVYTPQIVVQGARQAIGNERATIESLIASAPPLTGTVRLERLKGPSLRVRLAGTVPEEALPAEAVLLAVEREAASTVTAGENQGQHLHHSNVVRWIHEPILLAQPTVDLTIDLPAEAERELLVVLVHAAPGERSPGLGPLMAADVLSLPQPSTR